MATTERLCEFIARFRFEDIPARGVEQAKISILDTLGTALVGSKGPVCKIMVDVVKEIGGQPQARLIGDGTKTSVLNAALANGAFGHADDYDDAAGFGHPGVMLVPPVLALGEQNRLPGKKMLEAYAVGFEVGHKLGSSFGSVQGEGGFHSTSLFGAITAAAQSAKLLGLDVYKTRVALGIAASMASGIVQNFGTYTKPFHVGHASRNGVAAAILAKKGLTADPNIMEAGRGFAYVFGQQQCDIGRLTENIGKPLAIAEQGVRVKPWPCCAANHEALTGLLHLVQQHNIRPEEVDTIEVATSWKPPGATIRINPQTGFEGKFSLAYNMALALVDRKIDLNSYTDAKLKDPMMQALIGKVKAVWHPDRADRPLRLQNDPPRFVVVTLKLADGRVLSERQDYTTRRVLTGEDVLDKYRANARIAGMSEKKIQQCVELVQNLEDLDDVTKLMDAVTRNPRGSS